MKRQTTLFDDTVASRIEALLARCEGIRRGSECSRPVMFDQRGERHARSVAEAERVVAKRPAKKAGGSFDRGPGRDASRQSTHFYTDAAQNLSSSSNGD
jgi:hypothetical protein